MLQPIMLQLSSLAVSSRPLYVLIFVRDVDLHPNFISVPNYPPALSQYSPRERQGHFYAIALH